MRRTGNRKSANIVMNMKQTTTAETQVSRAGSSNRENQDPAPSLPSARSGSRIIGADDAESEECMRLCPSHSFPQALSRRRKRWWAQYFFSQFGERSKKPYFRISFPIAGDWPLK